MAMVDCWKQVRNWDWFCWLPNGPDVMVVCFFTYVMRNAESEHVIFDLLQLYHSSSRSLIIMVMSSHHHHHQRSSVVIILPHLLYPNPDCHQHSSPWILSFPPINRVR